MPILLQIVETSDTLTEGLTTNPEGTGEVAVKTLNVMDLAMKGGWIMIPIALMLLVAIYLFIERLIAINKAGREDAGFMNNIKDFILNGKIDAAVSLCKATKSPIARMIEKGITRIGRPLDDIAASIDNVGKLEVYKLERGIALMATISGAAPMLGFLGTVMGMIRAFFEMAANSDNGVQISALAGGIYEAMVTTVAGLIVGIIAYVAYNVLVNNVEKVIYKMEARSIEFMDILNEPSR